MVTLNPAGVSGEEQTTLIFDANEGNKELAGASKVYLHHGVVTDAANGTAWKYVKGNWGKDDGVGEMTKVAGQTNKWQITFSPNIRSYFGVPAGENIFRLSCVFRSADGTKKASISPGTYNWGTVISNGDIYISLKVSNYVSIQSPVGPETYINAGQSVPITADASSTATDMKVWIDEGMGYKQVATASGVRTINYAYKTDKTITINIKITATINGENVEAIKSHTIIVKKSNPILALPNGMKNGVNYISGDASKAVLVLLAPEKDFVFVVGDMTDWKIDDRYLMNKTPDGKTFWLELTNLTPSKSYVFQYWIDGNLKIADPYATQIADPWNDKYIEPSVFSDLPDYSKENFGIASVLKTGQVNYTWAASESTWKRPDVNHLVIYELHIRDFIASHNYKDLTDTLSYLKNLGVNAIELMPVSEFEGNDSWGYNPSFYFATDKYYGPRDQLKKFIETAHQMGMAVITDMVLNHAFGQCPLVQMYFDRTANKPASNNPWFNREYVGQYQWGYDFNHESAYTQQFVDDVNRYWMEEFHFDGFRFDFTKGFTNYAPGGSVDGFDQSRINIIKRMGDKIWQFDPKAYIILEHWAPSSEEAILGDYGMKMWRNKSYDFVPATVGNPIGTFSNTDATTHVSFYNSHDERRIAEHCLSEGRSTGSYNIKDTIVMFERVKMAAAFAYLQPGLKMIWQFDELGYDIDINFNGRIGKKPLVWGNGSLKYYDNPLRQNIYKTYKALLNLRNIIGPHNLATATKNHQPTGETRRLVYNTPDVDVVVVGNFGLVSNAVSPQFTQTGKWFDYITGDSMTITNTSENITLKPGEWHIYTSSRLSVGQPDIVGIYQNPVTITPNPFKGTDQIKIRFDATKATSQNLPGLIGVDKVYMHAGTIMSGEPADNLTNVVGNLKDDGVGQMTKIADNIWEITLIPNKYFNIATGREISKIGMYFRNGDNTKQGYGFRNSIIYFDVLGDLPIVYINPSGFKADSEITVVFNAKQGNRELAGADKIYMHSGVGVTNTTTPETSAWNKVVGNWGKDDGVGLMSKIPGETDKWQIKLIPKNYYGLTNSEFPYWIAAVFRDASGTKKGTANPGLIENGIIASNQDYFIKNASTVSADDFDRADLTIFPNPTSGLITIKDLDGIFTFRIMNADGRQVMQTEISNGDTIDLSHLPRGFYFIQINNKSKYKSAKLVIR
jgi:1,4-alpha-glucan branching enzyme